MPFQELHSFFLYFTTDVDNTFFERMEDIFDRYIRHINEDDWYTHSKIIETHKMVLGLNAIILNMNGKSFHFDNISNTFSAL